MLQHEMSTENLDQPEPLPFPFNTRAFCRYEPIERRIACARVLIINNLLTDDRDLSDRAREELGKNAGAQVRRESEIAEVALANIRNNIARLVCEPETHVAHLRDIAEAAAEIKPHAIVMSGTLSDFDYYNPQLIENFRRFITRTPIATLGICGAHQLVSLSFGARVVTLDNLEQWEQRQRRLYEYQYRFVRITNPDDPIFRGIYDEENGVWQDYTKEGRILRVWQNHGLQVEGVPEGFELLATSYLCKNQMTVRRTDEQLIYTVQFHLEKSFEDWNKSRATRWEHPNESRDGRIIFENFLQLALEHEAKRGYANQEASSELVAV